MPLIHPDGRYLVFNRLIDMCSSHLWAKDLSNNREVRLSDEAGHYSGLSWSVDGTQLAYILQSDCADTEPQHHTMLAITNYRLCPSLVWQPQ